MVLMLWTIVVRSTEPSPRCQFEGRMWYRYVSRDLARDGGGLTHLCINFFRLEMTSCSVSQKVNTEMGQAPTSQARHQYTCD